MVMKNKREVFNSLHEHIIKSIKDNNIDCSRYDSVKLMELKLRGTCIDIIDKLYSLYLESKELYFDILKLDSKNTGESKSKVENNKTLNKKQKNCNSKAVKELKQKSSTLLGISKLGSKKPKKKGK
jgi:hypothetical protein